MFGPNYSSVKLKLNLNLCIERLKILQKKHDNAGILKRKEVAEYLKQDKQELAEIKTEVVIRDDYYREALEILQMYCSLLLTRSGLLDSKPTLDESLKEAVCTLLWCAPRLAVDLREINEVKKQLGLRFGKELLEEARMSDCPGVSKRIVRKLSVAVPPHNIVVGYMQAIASTYNVPWKEAWNKEAPATGDLLEFGDGSGAAGDGYGGDRGGKGSFGMDPLGDEFQGIDLDFPGPMNPAYPPQHMQQPPPQQQQPLYPPAPPYSSQSPQQPQQQPLYPPSRPEAPSAPSVFPNMPPAAGDTGPDASFLDLPAIPTGFPSVGRGDGRGGSGGAGGSAGGGGAVGEPSADVPQFDELAARLSALRGK